MTSILAVYSALCEVASDRQAEVFDVSQPTLARLCGLSDKHVRTVLRKLEAIGLVGVRINRMPDQVALLPSTYRLLRCAYRRTEDPGLPSPGGESSPDLGKWKNFPVPCYEESPVRNEKKDGRTAGRVAAARFVAPSVEEWLAYATLQEPSWPKGDAEGAHDHYTANGWKQGRGKPIVNWQAAARTCIRNWRDRRGAEGQPQRPTAAKRLSPEETAARDEANLRLFDQSA
ncbi:MAG TPA: helix-turn-helix domain-containing protein [Opitutaceae bacterium]|nr:helix-turn-helix domain-containing protein [Opitutaceae bacterium]